MLANLSLRGLGALVAGILAVGVVASAAIWFWPTARPQTGPTTVDGVVLPSYPAEVVAQGRDIFVANCAVCHGERGQGNPVQGVPALNGSMHAWHHPDQQIAAILRNGQGAMPAVGAAWSDAEIGAVIAYVKQWWEPQQLAQQTRVSRVND